MLASATGAFVAAWLSFRYALSRFQRERAFDRRLAWYEKAVTALLGAYDRINWALAADVTQATPEVTRGAWSEAYEALYRLHSLAAESELYASNDAVQVLRDVSGEVVFLARATTAQLAKQKDRARFEQLMGIAGKMLRHAAATLSSDVRVHLGLPEIEREWSIFDHDYRAFLEELKQLKARGLDYSAGS